MKFSTLAGAIMAVSLAATAAVSVAAEKDQGHGIITFKGSIIDAPCSISQSSAYQEVEMAQVANVALKNGGKSQMTPFKIELLGCDLDNLKSVTAKFTGMPGGTADLLAIKGTTGASLAIADHNGDLIKNGNESSAQLLSNGDNYLLFNAYLQGDMNDAGGGGQATPAVVTPGNFESLANFTLSYQ